MLRLYQIRQDGRRKEDEIWNRWFQSVAKLGNEFNKIEDDPFIYGEQASVGLLAMAAAHAGYLALPEFAVRKVPSYDRRRRARGRADLWMCANEREWWFEAKQHFISRGSDRDLARKWKAAVDCAHAVRVEAARLDGVSVPVLIVSCWWLKTNCPEKLGAARDALERFGTSRQFAWRLGDADDGPETYFFFDIVKG